MKLTITLTLLFLSLGINLLSQNYDALKVNETIKVPYEPYNWETGSVETFNIDKARINNFFSKISEWENLQSILVIKDNKLIIEEYYKGTDKYSAFNTFSITKSVTSTLIGMAIKQGFIDSEDDPIIKYLPEYKEKINDDLKKELTIKHLLTMSSGIEPIEWWNPSIDYALSEAPIESKPGEKFLYYNALPHMLSVVISKSTNLSIKEFAEKHLFEPLDMKCAYWKKDGNYYSGRSNTYYTPRDIARLGYLYLQKGNINGKQLIDTSWIDKCFQNYADSDKNFFLTNYEVNQVGYGYLWWIMKANQKTYYCAYGGGDQFLLINPESNTIVVISQHYKDSWFEQKEDINLLQELLLIVDN